MKKVLNESPTRTIVHEDNKVMFRIESMQVQELPDQVADAILASWPMARLMEGEEPENKITVPWEYGAGPAWEKAKIENHLGDVEKTVGPDRPEIIEPAMPDDARDPDTGAVLKNKLNEHSCSTCGQSFPTLKGCRTHQARIHKI